MMQYPSNCKNSSSPLGEQSRERTSFSIISNVMSLIEDVDTVIESKVDVCESDDNGWYKPVPVPVLSSGGGGSGEDTLGEMGRVGSPSASASASVAASATSSPISSGKLKGRTAGTPERNRAGRRVSSGRQQQQVNRERRRRWSGAERQDYGAGASF